MAALEQFFAATYMGPPKRDLFASGGISGRYL